MPIARFQVPERLRGLVASAHGYRMQPLPGAHHRGLPSRHLTFVLNLDAPLVVDGLGARISGHCVVGGLHTTAVRIDASRPQDGIQLALTPAGARALLGVPARELVEGMVDLRDLAGRRADELLDRLADTPGWPQRLEVLGRWLRPVATVPAPAELGRAWARLVRSRGTIRIEDVAAEVGWSRRHLGERFAAFTGLTPKQLARVVRFEHARAHLARPQVVLADVAGVCGFTDQAHLTREWREMAGCTPTQWRREELPFLQDGAVDAAPP